MKRLAFAVIAALWLASASAQQVFPPADTIDCAFNTVPPTVSTGQMVRVQCDSQGRLILGAGAGPTGATTTTANSTIAVTNTYQQALAASVTRKSCLIQNQGTHTEQFYFGAIGSATTSNGLNINPGQTISCVNQNGLVLTDAVNITGTAGDAYVVLNQ